MNYEIVESFSQMVREKRIDKDTLAGVIEDVFAMMVRKKFGQESRFEVVVNVDKGDIEIYLEKQIVEQVTDPMTQIDLEAVKKKTDEPLNVGDDFVEVVDLQTFGRRLVVSAKQNLNQRIKEIEKEIIYNEYSTTVGEIIVGEIYQIRKGEILVIHNRNELILPKSEQIARERYRKGETLRAIVKEVRKSASSPLVIISRADPKFLAKLFEIEIPEIYDGIIEIKGVAREAGERSKVAVESHDDRIDAVGACVGMKGVRIHAIVRELNNENIDVINYSNKPQVFIQRALSPAKLKNVEVDEATKSATVLVDKDQVSLAIGRNGQNIRLASKLTGFEINLIKEGVEEEYDMDLDEFREELGEPLYERLVDEGYDTARKVIDAAVMDLLEIEGLTEEKIQSIKAMMQRELEEADIEEESEQQAAVQPAAAPAGSPSESEDQAPDEMIGQETKDGATDTESEAPDEATAKDEKNETTGTEAEAPDEAIAKDEKNETTETEA
ncbi:MAG: transcription termination/antitermination protein NusA [Ignavibacteria bacterium]|nr:MAG: transcription termination/antitermination protein NusA [Ignavibacteria bacterium]